jgi:hypothetical protein
MQIKSWKQHYVQCENSKGPIPWRGFEPTISCSRAGDDDHRQGSICFLTSSLAIPVTWTCDVNKSCEGFKAREIWELGQTWRLTHEFLNWRHSRQVERDRFKETLKICQNCEKKNYLDWIENGSLIKCVQTSDSNLSYILFLHYFLVKSTCWI